MSIKDWFNNKSKLTEEEKYELCEKTFDQMCQRNMYYSFTYKGIDVKVTVKHQIDENLKSCLINKYYNQIKDTLDEVNKECYHLDITHTTNG